MLWIISLSCLVLTCKTSLAQQSFTITPEISKEIIQKKEIRNLKIYPTSYKEVEYREYETAEVPTKEYQYALESLEHYKSDYDAYVNKQKSNSEKKKAIQEISTNIDKFLDSDEKYAVKEQYLIEAQKIASTNEIQIVTDKETSLLKRLANNAESGYGNPNTTTRTILLYDGDKRTSKADLKLYKESLQNIKFDEPEKTHNYRKYVELFDSMGDIKKTEAGTALSNKISKKPAFVIDENPIEIDMLSGTFTELPKKYMLTLSDVEGRFSKNELVFDLGDYHNVGKLSKPYSLIKKVGTEEHY